MQPKPSWWQSMLATLRRPPVLALATVVVVVGGAVFVTRHHEAVEAPAVMAPPAAAPSGTIAREETELSRGSSAPVVDSSKEAGGSTGAAAGSGAAPASKADVVVPSVHKAEPTIANPRPQAHHQPPRDTVSPDSSRAPAPPTKVVAKPADDKAPEVLRQKDTDRLGADESPTLESGHGKAAGAGESGSAPGAAASDPSPAQPVAQPSPPPAPRPVTTPAANAATSLDQLFKQCQLAAARGDCDAVKQLAARIAKASATVYRDRVTKDAAVVKCLQ